MDTLQIKEYIVKTTRQSLFQESNIYSLVSSKYKNYYKLISEIPLFPNEQTFQKKESPIIFIMIFTISNKLGKPLTSSVRSSLE
jgi:hypothetical protein